MDYERAKHVGDAAEAKVAAVLSTLQATQGFVILNDVLIGKVARGSTITAQLDHVVIDEMGILVIETKVRTGAVLRGTYADTKWTACYPSGKKAPFQNPLLQNAQHLNLLHQLLKDFNPDFQIERVRGLVVFVNTDISRLELDSVNKGRVQTVETLEPWFEDRRAFMIQTPLSPDEQVALAGLVVQLDRANDPATAKAHQEYRGTGRPTEFISAPPASEPYVARFGSSGGGDIRPVVIINANESRASHDFISIRTLLVSCLVIALGGLAIWAGLGIWHRTAPWWVYLAGFAILAALGGEEQGRSRRRSRRSSASKGPGPSFLQRLLALMLSLAVLALAFGGFVWYFDHVLIPSLAHSASSAVPAAGTVDVAQARGALKDSAPNIYKALVDSRHPKTAIDGTNVSYEWEYLEKGSAASAQVKRIRITLDSSGKIVGVTNP